MVFLNLRACAASARQAAFAQLNPHQQVGFDRIEASMQSGGIRHSAPFDARLTAFGMTPRRCEPGTKTSASESALLRESLCFWALGSIMCSRRGGCRTLGHLFQDLT